jgi:hypothetical protein
VTTPAVTIQDAIDFCADNIAELSYDGVVSIKTRMTDWIDDVFGAAGVFPPSFIGDDGQRRVIDWYGTNVLANEAIEGPAAGDSGVVGTCACIDAVVRTLCAVRDATAAGSTTVGQRTATIAAFNTQWT